MKKIILSLAMAAFLLSGSAIIASESFVSVQEVSQIAQDGKKKDAGTSTATKKTTETKAENKDAAKGEDCGTAKEAKKDDCGGSDVLKKKSCCSDGKTSKEKSTSPEKK